MAKREKMPKFSGFRMTKDGLGPPVYEVTMTVAPDDYGVSHSATNREMVHGVFNHVNGEMLALRARAEAAEQRAEAAEARAAQAEAAGYRRAIDEACAALDKRYAALERRLVDDDHYGAGRLRGLDLAEEIVRALAPVEPVSNADKLPGGDR